MSGILCERFRAKEVGQVVVLVKDINDVFNDSTTYKDG